MRFTWWPATRGNPRPWPKGAAWTPSQAGRRAGPGHAGEGQAAHSRPDPARRSGSALHAGQRAADHDPADHCGHGGQGRAYPYRRVWHLRPPACLGLSAQNGLPRARRVRPRRGRGWLLRGARQHDRGVLVPAALLAPPAPGDLAGQAAALSRVLSVRAQRTPSRQSPAWRARRRLGRMRQTQHPENQQEPGPEEELIEALTEEAKEDLVARGVLVRVTDDDGTIKCLIRSGFSRLFAASRQRQD